MQIHHFPMPLLHDAWMQQERDLIHDELMHFWALHVNKDIDFHERESARMRFYAAQDRQDHFHAIWVEFYQLEARNVSQ